jgi:hypothetical protein
VTDHDGVSGVLPAEKAAKDSGIKVVSGVELSIDYQLPTGGHLHLIGLFVNVQNKALNDKLLGLKNARRERAKEIIRLLNTCGIEIDPTEILLPENRGSIGRPHIAENLIRKKAVKSTSEAFRKYIGKGAPAYVPKKKLRLDEAIDLIHQSKGLAILAHPVSLGFSVYPETGEEIHKLIKYGLDGLEVYYPGHDRYFTGWLLDLAKSKKLAVSGGSDFHGSSKPGVLPGTGKGDLFIHESVFENLFTFYSRKFS